MRRSGYLWRLAAGILLLALLAAGGISYSAGQRGLRMARALGAGINVGNSLDVYGVSRYHPDASVTDYETFWNNPPISAELLDAILAQGFSTVRLPVSWGEHQLGDGSVDPLWMARVEEVVDQALDRGFYVILDLHHESWLVPTPEQEAAVTERLCVLWEQIARTFAQRGERLLFEGMNEPRLKDSEEWTSGTPEMQQVINRLNAAFVRTVRAAGGENEERWLLLPAYCTSHREEALQALELPEDPYLMVTVHAYLPYDFTLDETGSRTWDPETDAGEIDALAQRLQQLFLRRRIPVVITEFGCHDRAEEAHRLRWAEYYLKTMTDIGVPCIWWDNGDESRLFDRESGECTAPQLAGVLTAGAVQ